MNIGLDFDGVISNSALLKSRTIKKIHGKDIPPDDFRKEVVVDEGHLTLEEYRSLQKIVYETREVGLQLEPMEGSIRYIRRLLRDGHDLTVITSRGEAGLRIAKEWMTSQGMRLKLVGIGTNTNKAPLCVGLDVFVDDDYHKLKPLAGVVPHRFLFSWKHNLHITDETVGRIKTWEELYYIILSL